MAECIDNAGKKSQVVSYGSDDSVKAAGNKRLDVKTAHITIIGEDRSRESFCSGFYLNATHSGKDSAKTVAHDISKMEILTDNT